MAKYHISPDGFARRCNAGKGDNARGCRYGYSEAEHYTTREEAKKGAEEKMKEENGGSFKRKKPIKQNVQKDKKIDNINDNFVNNTIKNIMIFDEYDPQTVSEIEQAKKHFYDNIKRIKESDDLGSSEKDLAEEKQKISFVNMSKKIIAQGNLINFSQQLSNKINNSGMSYNQCLNQILFDENFKKTGDIGFDDLVNDYKISVQEGDFEKLLRIKKDLSDTLEIVLAEERYENWDILSNRAQWEIHDATI